MCDLCEDEAVATLNTGTGIRLCAYHLELALDDMRAMRRAVLRSCREEDK